LCVIGPSGSGKSSLVYAGVIPELGRSRQFGTGEWDVRTLRPGAKPLTALAAALNLSSNELSVFPLQREELEEGKSPTPNEQTVLPPQREELEGGKSPYLASPACRGGTNRSN
ncbi:MAG: hypothetical protein HQ525_10115, partial [Anaerolineae bacterium]|nr:hypothetical protein [Anaerolineae bacterium]